MVHEEKIDHYLLFVTKGDFYKFPTFPFDSLLRLLGNVPAPFIEF